MQGPRQVCSQEEQQRAKVCCSSSRGTVEEEGVGEEEAGQLEVGEDRGEEGKSGEGEAWRGEHLAAGREGGVHDQDHQLCRHQGDPDMSV